jgi:hypothetical protein
MAVLVKRLCVSLSVCKCEVLKTENRSGEEVVSSALNLQSCMPWRGVLAF